MESPNYFLKEIVESYYIVEKGGELYLYKRIENNGIKQMSEVEFLKLGIIEIRKDEFTDNFKKFAASAKNTLDNCIIFNWWAYKKNEIEDDEYRKTLNDEMYDKALELLPANEFIIKRCYKELVRKRVI